MTWFGRTIYCKIHSDLMRSDRVCSLFTEMKRERVSVTYSQYNRDGLKAWIQQNPIGSSAIKADQGCVASDPQILKGDHLQILVQRVR